MKKKVSILTKQTRDDFPAERYDIAWIEEETDDAIRISYRVMVQYDTVTKKKWLKKKWIDKMYEIN
jgi:hypothetical protein